MKNKEDTFTRWTVLDSDHPLIKSLRLLVFLRVYVVLLERLGDYVLVIYVFKELHVCKLTAKRIKHQLTSSDSANRYMPGESENETLNDLHFKEKEKEMY